MKSLNSHAVFSPLNQHKFLLNTKHVHMIPSPPQLFLFLCVWKFSHQVMAAKYFLTFFYFFCFLLCFLVSTILSSPSGEGLSQLCSRHSFSNLSSNLLYINLMIVFKIRVISLFVCVSRIWIWSSPLLKFDRAFCTLFRCGYRCFE